MKILVIDNEKEIREVLTGMLRSGAENHEIEEAEGVESGLAKIYSFNPDLVLLDIEMNDGTGFDLLKKNSRTNIPTHFYYRFQSICHPGF
ncbi:MAG: response regulator [Chitinophagaceae bacterium]|nr:response regulator [Chitinophagaceae bacterium]